MSDSVRPLLERSVSNPEGMDEIAELLVPLLEPGTLLVLVGPLGAGKTTLARAIGARLGVTGMASPTFIIARTHRTDSGVPLVHADAYRLSSATELDDLDIDFASSIVLLEWGRGLVDGIHDSWLELEIEPQPETEVRKLRLFGFGPRWRGVRLG